ncbi:protein DpdE [Nocardia sp. NPDC052278]|uniref:protein DpdE n=1 Tax=Nocardia sp. NPDC052278 TaxID=3364328 RepID=UPI0037CC7D7F
MLHDSIPGIGRVAEQVGNTVRVEAFDSAANPVAQSWWLPVNDCRSVELDAQTRVFWKDPDTGVWTAGRVDEADGSICWVRFPNGAEARVPLAQLWVRWDRPVSSPVEVLAAGANESAYFRDARLPMLASLVKQRSACASFPAVLSSAVEVYPHQVAAALTVLSDPVQRYLLADEVGLGKTIEAGLIIRQHLLDNPTARIAVIVPDFLRRQWLQELKTKFFVDDFPASVLKISAHETPEKWRNYHGFDLVVVDEVHQLTRSGDPRVDSYPQLVGLAHSVPRLLLLSATPAIARPDVHLALLHLLDPDLYRWDSRAEFVRRFNDRRALAEAVSGLDANFELLLEDTIGSVRDLLPPDPRFNELASGITNLLTEDGDLRDETFRPELHEAVEALRAHIGETYRLHRRIVRYRRATVIGTTNDELPVFEATGRRRPREIGIGTDRSESALTLLLDWQQRVAEWLLDHPTESARDTRQAAYGRVLAVLVSRTDELSDDLLNALRWRIIGDERSRQRADLDSIEAGFLAAAPVLPFESEILARVEELPCSEAVMDRLHVELRRSDRAVVFCGRGQMAIKIADILATTDDGPRVHEHTHRLDAATIDKQLCEWRNDGGALVVDGSGEEGINLQDADLVINMRLPWSPNRLEQRLGRVDRFAGALGGTGQPARQFADPMGRAEESFAAAWLELLVSAFGAFDGSLSALQDCLDDLQDDVWSVGLCEGPHAMLRRAQHISDTLARQRREIDAMDAIDAVQDATFGEDIAQRVNHIESEWSTFEAHMRRFLGNEGGLRFTETMHEDGRIIEFGVNLKQAPLVSPMLLARFASGQRGNTHSGVPRESRCGAFNRNVALRIPETRLFRLGNPFVDHLARVIEVDDRGQASAFWRPGRLDDPNVYFGFHLVAEADVSNALELAGSEPGVAQALRRQADWFLPPFMGQIWLCSGANDEVADPALLRWLTARYNPQRGDLNLNPSRAGALIGVFGSVNEYAAVARHAEQAAVQQFARRENVRSQAEQAYQAARRQLAIRRAQAMARRTAGRLVTDTESYLEDVRVSDRIAAALRQPRIRVVSATCIIGGDKMELG